MSFRALDDHELYALDDEALVAYAASAKRADEPAHAERALMMLLYKHEDRMRARVALRLPAHLAHHLEAVADWVLRRVWRSALAFKFRGGSAGEWVNWWKVVVDRQVVSFWRTTQGQALEAGSGDPEALERVGSDLDVDRLVAQACYADIVQAVLDAMGNEVHVAVVRLAIFEDQPSKAVGSRFGLTAANVDKIKQRFKDDLRAECVRRGVDPS